MKTTLVYPRPEIYQLDPSIVPFSSLRQARSSSSQGETPAVPFIPKEHAPPHLRQAGTVVELTKHRPIAQHVGATHHHYPIDVVGDTLLKQQALLTITSLPSIIARLREDIGVIANARNGMASSKKRTPPKARRKEEDSAAEEEAPFDEEAEEEIVELERLLGQIERVQLRIGRTDEPLADKDLLALKRLEVVSQQTVSATQASARKLATEATTAIKVKVASLKVSTPQPANGDSSAPKKK